MVKHRDTGFLWHCPRYENIKYMSISDYGKVACCERGIYYTNLPSNVEQAIDNFKYTPPQLSLLIVENMQSLTNEVLHHLISNHSGF